MNLWNADVLESARDLRARGYTYRQIAARLSAQYGPGRGLSWQAVRVRLLKDGSKNETDKAKSAVLS